MTLGLIALCTAIYVGIALGGPEVDFLASQRVGLVPGLLFAADHKDPIGNWGLPTLVTALFLHATPGHLVANMLMLLVIGRPVEWVLGRLRLLVLYLAAGVVGSVAQTLVDPQSMVPVIGASGAIAGLFGAYALMFSRERVKSRRIAGAMVDGAALRALWIVATWIALQLLVQLGLGGMAMIAIWAHIAGFITGLILGPLLLAHASRAALRRAASPKGG